MAYRLLAAIALIALGGCGHIAKLPENYAVDAKSPNGAVIVSLTFEGELQFSAFTLEYRLVRGGETQSMHSASILASPDIDSDGRRGWLFPRELPPGEYEFYKWRGMMGNASYWSPRDFSNRFTVSAGRITYIGSVNVLTSSTAKRYQVQVRDERERDIAAFLTRYPKVKREQVEFDIMSEDMNAPGRRDMQLDDFKDVLPDAAERRRQEEERRRMDELKDLLPGTAK
jgi:hypothetical protein